MQPFNPPQQPSLRHERDVHAQACHHRSQLAPPPDADASPCPAWAKPGDPATATSQPALDKHPDLTPVAPGHTQVLIKVHHVEACAAGPLG